MITNTRLRNCAIKKDGPEYHYAISESIPYLIYILLFYYLSWLIRCIASMQSSRWPNAVSLR